MPEPTYEEMYDVLASVLDDLDSWSTCGSEGYTDTEMERREEYDKFLDRLVAAISDEKNDKVSRFIAL